MDRHREFKAIKIGLMRSEEFGLLRGLMMLGQTTFTEDIPTACTNGRDEWYNLDFLFDGISNGRKGIGFIQVHEPMHKAGRHLTIYASLHKIDPQLTNAACDYWINDRIITADPKGKLVEMPRDREGKVMGLYEPKYHGWTIKRIFDHLREEEEKGEAGDGEKGDDDGSGGFDEHDWEGAAGLSEEEQVKLVDDVKQAIRQGIHAAKKAGAGGVKDVLGLGELVKPQINWRQQLRMFMNSTCQRKERSTWRRPNRRYLHQDIIMPTLEGNSIREVVLARDTSGSMTHSKRLEKVTTEMASIATLMRIDTIHLIDWDGAVERHEVYTSDQLKNPHELKRTYGGGGTDPSCVAEYLKDKNIKPECIIVLTDGEINNWGTWRSPLLWAIVNDEKITAPMGKTININ